MPLPTSGPISINDIKAEFGGTAPDSLTEYYRGGSLVPNTPANAGIPTSGAISILDFYGASAGPSVTINITNRTIAATGIFGGVTSSIRFDTNGQLQITDSIGVLGPVTGEWATPITTGVGSSYQVRATLSSGVTPAGPALGVWHTISSNRQWSVSDFNEFNPATTSTLVISIRDVATSTIQDTATITLSAQATGGSGR